MLEPCSRRNRIDRPLHRRLGIFVICIFATDVSGQALYNVRKVHSIGRQLVAYLCPQCIDCCEILQKAV